MSSSDDQNPQAVPLIRRWNIESVASAVEKPLRRRKSKKPRVELLATARRLVKLHGRWFGIDSLLAEAGCAKASLYAHFSSKDGLLEALCAEETKEFVQSIWDLNRLSLHTSEDLVMGVRDWMLKRMSNLDSYIGISTAILITGPSKAELDSLPRATEAARRFLHQAHLDLNRWLMGDLRVRSDASSSSAVENFMTQVFVAFAARSLFPEVAPEDQLGLKQAVSDLRCSFRIESAAHSADSVHAQVHA